MNLNEVVELVVLLTLNYTHTLIQIVQPKIDDIRLVLISTSAVIIILHNYLHQSVKMKTFEN